jgi:hypothetical protein
VCPRPKSSGGDLSAKNVTGAGRLKTSGGSEPPPESIRGDVDANTSCLDVRLAGVDGKNPGLSSGGSLRFTLVGANRGNLRRRPQAATSN